MPDAPQQHKEDHEARQAQADAGRISSHLEEIPPADGAEVIRHLPLEQAAEVAEYLDPSTAGHILAEMEPEDAASVIQDMHPPEAAMVLAAMAPDDRVDILEHVEDQRHSVLLAELPAPQATETIRLEQYPRESAGGLMNPNVTALAEDLTVQQAIDELRRLRGEQEQMFYTYIVDAGGQLRGVISMRDLILSQPHTPLREIIRRDVTSVPATMDQEEVAALFTKYNYLALPVVDSDQQLLGIVTVDDVVDVISREATEDVQRMAGAGPQERLTTPWQVSFRQRLPWLLVNLLTAFFAATVVGLFESTIARLAILAVYLPVVGGMGGNASAQAMAVTIRGIALGELDRGMLRRLFAREMLVGAASGAVIGFIVAVAAWLFHYQAAPMLGLVAAVAMLVTLTCACVAGVAIPIIMRALGFDPAQSATIFSTTITDFVGFSSFLGLAYLLLPVN